MAVADGWPAALDEQSVGLAPPTVISLCPYRHHLTCPLSPPPPPLHPLPPPPSPPLRLPPRPPPPAAARLQSDKASIEITSRYSGRVVALHHPTGAVVKVGA